MKALTVAKKDFRDASQSRALWALVGIFVVLMLIIAYAVAEAPEVIGISVDVGFNDLLFMTSAFAALFVPLAAIIVCYKSIAGERELGSIKIIMSLPTTRQDVFFGKVLGRGAVITTALAVAVVIGLGFGSVLLGTVDIVAVFVFLLLTIFFALVYASIMVGLSASTGSTVRATTYTLGFFAVFELLWDAIPLAIVYVVEGFQMPTTFPDWFTTVLMISPSTGYFAAVNAFVPGIEAETTGGGAEAGVEVDTAYGDAIYAQPEVGLLFLVIWMIVSLAVGYSRFSRADL